jgi:hypothetical protein
MVITFPYTFRFDNDELYATSFFLDLSTQEIADIKRFIQDNPDLPFWAMDYDYPDLFDKMMEAHQHAIVEGINSVKKDQGEPPISADNIDWEDLPLYFDWPGLFKKMPI